MSKNTELITVHFTIERPYLEELTAGGVNYELK